MRSTWTLALAAMTLCGAVGCGNSETPSPAAGTSAAAAGAPADPVSRVVFEFLDAVRQGNTAAASQRLTPLALQRTSEMDLNFSPPGSATARFTVGSVRKVEADKALVESMWTDLDADGKPNQESIVWALRLTDGQWRISGMAAELGPDQPPVIIDFENPESMVEREPAPSTPGAPATNPSAPRPTDKVAADPFQQSTPR
jgi:hypothetical protein